MTTIYRSDAGQIVQVTDVYGTYYYTADDFGQPCCGGYTSEDDARTAMDVAEADRDLGESPESDIEIDRQGRRMVECAYCNRQVPVGDSVPAADDDDAWEQEADSHDEDCEWVRTRAHRRD